MSAAIQISRDTEGVRVEVRDAGDARALHELGPWVYDYQGDEWTFLPDADGTNEVQIHGEGGRGIRFFDYASGRRAGTKTGRFGPVEVEADIYSSDGFSVVLPPLHERPWPILRENEGCYDVGEQLVLTLAERINDLIDFSGMPVKNAIRLQGRNIPSDLRRFLPVGDSEAIVRCQMARLRLPLEPR